ncbi:MAG: DUF2442 domain-containing protein [Flavobacteriales bacterium]
MTIPENVFIKSAKYLGDYRVAFRFTDGRATELDFHGFLSAPSQNPMAAQFLDVIRFKAFTIKDRTDIVWGDWEMCFPFAALYAGDLDVDSLGNKMSVGRKPAGPRSIRQVPTAEKPARAPRKTHVTRTPKAVANSARRAARRSK